jgi:CDGSH-type Zn-finger protein
VGYIDGGRREWLRPDEDRPFLDARDEGAAEAACGGCVPLGGPKPSCDGTHAAVGFDDGLDASHAREVEPEI